MKFSSLCLIVTLSLIISSEATAENVKMPDMPLIKATVKEAIPGWAAKQRNLFKAINEAAPLYLKTYTYPGGWMKESRKIDDDYECFNNWPIFYMMGGDEKIFKWGLDEFSAITRQWTFARGKSVKDEFVKCYDPLHLTEGYEGFQFLGLGDPTIPENIDRARRFAGYYLNEVPGVFNYDPKYKVMRSIATGSEGPAETQSGSYAVVYGHASLYPVVKEERKLEWADDKKKMEEFQKLYDKMVTPCDIPANLALTGLITHAYILTGDEKYKKWVLEYVDAWIERTKQNKGIIPDNVGRTGKIGEYRNGQWWGGLFGWSSRYSLEIMFRALITATECAHLISGDAKYEYLLRSQVDVLFNQGKTIDGNFLVPFQFCEKGWYDYRPMEPFILSSLWNDSMSPEDWKKIEILKNGTKNGPWAYGYGTGPNPPPPGAEEWHSNGTLYDWNKVLDDLSENKHRMNESPRLSYLGGTNPDWPDKLLDAEFTQVRRNVERIKSGTYKHEWAAHDIHAQDPVMTTGLAQMTMGAPYYSFNGGLLRGRVRYYDMDKTRPGLPEDVAALVEKLEADKTVIYLVNISANEPRKLIVQGGTYGEHNFTDVKYMEETTGSSGDKTLTEKTIPVNGNFFAVELPPATSARLVIGTKLFANKPTYAFPWQR